MAESKKSKHFSKKPIPIAPETPPVATETAPEPAEPQPPEAFSGPSGEATPGRRRGRPPSKETQDNFWNAQQEIPRNEYIDKRAYVYIYIREPFCDLKTEGQPGYLLKVYEPIDPDFIMRRWGSGKYYLCLKRRAQGSRTDNTVADLTFEIYNPEFPPKLPRELWHRDSRNERWLALLPKEAATPQQNAPPPLEQVADFLRLGTELRREAREELMQATPPPAPAPPAVSPAGGIKEVFEAASQVLQMRSDNPMVSILQDEVKAMREELRSEREAARRFEAQLAEQRLKALEEKLSSAIGQNKPADDSGDWLEKLEKAEERKERLKALFGGGDGGSRRRSFGELALDWGSKVLESPAIAAVGQAIAQRMMAGPTQPNGVAGPPAPMQNGQQPQSHTPEQEFQNFIPMATKAMLGYLSNSENTGDMFADWMYAGWPDKFAQLKNLTHPMMPGQQGAPVIVAFYQHSPYWQAITAFEGGEERFRKFVDDFCAYKPEGSDHSENIAEAEHEDIEDGEEKTTELEV